MTVPLRVTRRTWLVGATALAATAATPKPCFAKEKVMQSEEVSAFEVIVIGGSFAGLSAAIQLARARRRILLLDGGKPRNRFAPASHGFLGQDGKPPHEIMTVARQQVLRYPTVRFEAAEVTAAQKEQDQFIVRFGTGKTAKAKRLILATGVQDILPEIPGVKELWGKSIAHCPYCHGYEVAEQRLAVLHSGPNSIHQAVLLRDWSEEVTLLTNGAVLTADEQEQLRTRGVKIEVGRVVRLRHKDSRLESVEFAEGGSRPLDALFLTPRYTLASPLAMQLGCEIEEGKFGPVIKTDTLKETTVPGVFAAGDAARTMHNATWASADGVTAGAFSHQSLIFPRQTPPAAK
jgi:thioredoxin reductase